MCIDKYKYSIPVLQKSENSWFKCEKIRHPIVERLSDNYVPFDMELGLTEYTGITLFGLNSAGKSTLQKSVGLNIILAQMGYPVACVKLEYSPYHSLFTRISGNDNLFKGLSSFSVEMLEIRNILKRTNNRSLIIADEVCRGTEYESGLIIVLTMIKLLSEKKANFINTCDAMIHARQRGESFGLSVAEFLSLDKPVLAWEGGRDLNHLEMLKDSYTLYNEDNFIGKLIHFLHHLLEKFTIFCI
jgi:hypothetical protein